MSLCIIHKTPARIFLAEEKLFRQTAKGAEIGGLGETNIPFNFPTRDFAAVGV